MCRSASPRDVAARGAAKAKRYGALAEKAGDKLICAVLGALGYISKNCRSVLTDIAHIGDDQSRHTSEKRRSLFGKLSATVHLANAQIVAGEVRRVKK